MTDKELLQQAFSKDELKHHGILGMRWGFRKDGYTHGYIPKYVNSTKEFVSNASKKTIATVKEAYKKDQEKKEAKKNELYNGNPHGRPKKLFDKRASKLSDKELAAIAKRAKIESGLLKEVNKSHSDKNSKKLMEKILNYNYDKKYRKAVKNIHKLSDEEIAALTARLKAENAYYGYRNESKKGITPTEEQKAINKALALYLSEMTDDEPKYFENQLNKGGIDSSFVTKTFIKNTIDPSNKFAFKKAIEKAYNSDNNSGNKKSSGEKKQPEVKFDEYDTDYVVIDGVRYKKSED